MLCVRVRRFLNHFHAEFRKTLSLEIFKLGRGPGAIWQITLSRGLRFLGYVSCWKYLWEPEGLHSGRLGSATATLARLLNAAGLASRGPLNRGLSSGTAACSQGRGLSCHLCLLIARGHSPIFFLCQ